MFFELRKLFFISLFLPIGINCFSVDFLRNLDGKNKENAFFCFECRDKNETILRSCVQIKKKLVSEFMKEGGSVSDAALDFFLEKAYLQKMD